ncbi:unnamed protein product [Rhodiola kirilowii]
MEGSFFDLLNDRRKLCMREGWEAAGSALLVFKSTECLVWRRSKSLSRGEKPQEVPGTTGANEESQGSHAILQLVIKKSVDFSETKQLDRGKAVIHRSCRK